MRGSGQGPEVLGIRGRRPSRSLRELPFLSAAKSGLASVLLGGQRAHSSCERDTKLSILFDRFQGKLT